VRPRKRVADEAQRVSVRVGVLARRLARALIDPVRVSCRFFADRSDQVAGGRLVVLRLEGTQCGV